MSLFEFGLKEPVDQLCEDCGLVIPQVVFEKETEERQAKRKYRESHDRAGHYFNNPNRAQRRHIAGSWKGHRS